MPAGAPPFACTRWVRWTRWCIVHPCHSGTIPGRGGSAVHSGGRVLGCERRNRREAGHADCLDLNPERQGRDDTRGSDPDEGHMDLRKPGPGLLGSYCRGGPGLFAFQGRILVFLLPGEALKRPGTVSLAPAPGTAPEGFYGLTRGETGHVPDRGAKALRIPRGCSPVPLW